MINKIITAQLHDVRRMYGDVFNHRSLRLTLNKVNSRLSSEGPSFLTKALPRLGKAFDRALCHQEPLDATKLRFKPMPGTKLPMLFGEFFKRVLDINGYVLQDPCVDSVRVIRQLTACFYKLKLPYSDEQEQKVIQAFEKAEDDIRSSDERLRAMQLCCSGQSCTDNIRCKLLAGNGHNARARKVAYGGAVGVVRHNDKLGQGYNSCPCTKKCRDRLISLNGAEFSQFHLVVLRRARRILSDLFACFDPKDIYPRHGPGAVATKQRLWNKYLWTNVSANITRVYPLDEYFYSSLGHVCDALHQITGIGEEDLPARVILVPKDSRGPRLISAEPVDYQWIQQGLGQALRDHVEKHVLTKYNVFFTDQGPNQRGALLGSSTGRYATLDLKEASDRISLELVRLLFPDHIRVYLEACRSSSTVLPDGRILKLQKFAPMGSNLCFPILAITVWAILTAGTRDTDTQQSILVYGDDVIVPTAYAADAIELLELFGLLVNRDKSCIKGFFRESCGVDAFKGENVTPVRVRTVWSSSPSAASFESYVEYSNEFYKRGYYITSEEIARELVNLYGPIPGKDMALPCPSLYAVTDNTSLRRRWKSGFQRPEYHCLSVKSPPISFEVDGWVQLLRYFAESANQRNLFGAHGQEFDEPSYEGVECFSADTYTRRDTAVLKRRWVAPWWKHQWVDSSTKRNGRVCDDSDRPSSLE